MSFETGYSSTLSAKLIPADTTIDVATPPTATSGRMHIYKGTTHSWINYTGVSGNTLTGVTFVSQTTDPITVVAGNTFPAGTAIELVEMHDQIFDKQKGGTVYGDTTFVTDVIMGTSMKVPVYADATARDVGIPTPENGMIIYNTALGIHQQYIAGAWASFATGSVVNADTSTAGKVEIATNAEFIASTDTGGTGATLSVPPSIINKSNLSEYIAGEALTANDMVMLEIQRGFAFNANTGLSSAIVVGDASARTKRSIKIIGNGVSASSMKLSLDKTGAPADSIVIRIETDSAGNPSGTLADANATCTIAGSALTTSFVDTTVTFGGAFTLTDLTLYHIVAQRVTAVDASNYYNIGGYTRNMRGFQTNTYNGSVWGTAGGTVMPYVSYTGAYSVVAVKTNATNSDNTNWYGSVTATTAIGSLCTIRRDGLSKTFSGLTPNVYYYLSNTPGLISTTPGTNVNVVGISESTTNINIINNPKITANILSASSSATATSSIFEGRGILMEISMSVGDSATGGTATLESSYDGVTFTTVKSITTAAPVVSFTFSIPGVGYYRFVLSGVIHSYSINY